MTKPPHHDAPTCAQCAGPLVSPDGSGIHPTAATMPDRLRCAACGAWWHADPTNDDDLRKLLHAWWSAGAWEGVQWQAEQKNDAASAFDSCNRARQAAEEECERLRARLKAAYDAIDGWAGDRPSISTSPGLDALEDEMREWLRAALKETP